MAKSLPLYHKGFKGNREAKKALSTRFTLSGTIPWIFGKPYENGTSREGTESIKTLLE